MCRLGHLLGAVGTLSHVGERPAKTGSQVRKPSTMEAWPPGATYVVAFSIEAASLRLVLVDDLLRNDTGKAVKRELER